MAILNIFKKEKKKPPSIEAPESKEKKTKQEIIKETEVTKEKKVEKIPEIEKLKKKEEKKISQAYKILKSLHITEKATELAKENQYVFRIWPRANKIEIKKAIEGLYDVDVLSVKIINIPPKPRRLGRTLGWRQGYKKAIVKIEKGQKIEVLPR